MPSRYVTPYAREFEADGLDVGAGYKLNFYAAGTSTRSDTYSDIAYTTPNANPVVADSEGRFGNIWLIGTYKVVLTDEDDAQIWSADNVSGAGGGGIGDAGIFETAQDLRDFATPSGVLFATTLGAGTVDDKGGGPWRWDSLSVLADDTGLTLLPTGHVGAGRWKRVLSGHDVYIAWFDPARDGITDDSAILNALFASNGTTAHLQYGADYYTTESLVVPDYCKLNMHGAKITINTDGSKRGIDLYNNTDIFDGEVEYSGTNIPAEGWWSCPIFAAGGHFNTAGDFNGYSPGEGVKNIDIRNMSLVTTRPGGQAITIGNDTHNVRIINTEYPSSSELGRCIVVHWGYDGVDVANGTTHPYNIKIEGLLCEDQSKLSSNQGMVFTSGAYNLDANLCHAMETPNFDGFRDYGGDYALQHAPAWLKKLGFHGMSFRNSSSRLCHHGMVVDVRSGLGDGSFGQAGVTFQQVSTIGTGAGHGQWVPYGEKVRFQDCKSYGHLAGGRPTAHSVNVDFNGCTFEQSYHVGFQTLDNSTTTQDIRVTNCLFKDNNQEDIPLRGDATANFGENIMIDGNMFDSPLCDFHIITAALTDDIQYLSVRDNVHRGISAEVFARPLNVGNPADKQVFSIRDNKFLNDPDNGINNASFIPAVRATPSSYGSGYRTLCWDDQFPDGLNDKYTWRRGDIVFNQDFDGLSGSVSYWQCMAEGMPGTWLAITV